MSSLSDQILSAASAAGINPPQLALEIAIQESGPSPNPPPGGKGEIGTFQLLPSSFPGYSLQQLQDPTTNISLGIGYLGSMLAQFGDPVAAVAAYNAGPSAVSSAISRYGNDTSSGYPAWFQGIPSSTQSYVIAIFNNLASQYSINFNLGTPEPGVSYPGNVSSAGVPTSTPPAWVFALAIGGLALLWWWL